MAVCVALNGFGREERDVEKLADKLCELLAGIIPARMKKNLGKVLVWIVGVIIFGAIVYIVKEILNKETPNKTSNMTCTLAICVQIGRQEPPQRNPDAPAPREEKNSPDVPNRGPLPESPRDSSPHRSKPVPGGTGQPYQSGPLKIALPRVAPPSCKNGPTIDDPCAPANSEESHPSIISPNGGILSIFDQPSVGVPWWPELSPEMGRPSRLQYEWQSDGSKIELRIDLDKSTPIAPLRGCLAGCQFAPISPVVKGTISYGFDQSLIFLTMGAYPRSQFLAVPMAGNNTLPDWTAGIGFAYAVRRDLSVWAAYDHASYVGQGCGFACSSASQNLGRFSDDRVTFGLSWRPQK
jgi:hypothetical protein